MIINPTRLAGGLGAGVLALTALAFTAADANAASAGTDWTDGNSRFTMSVSDSTPKVGDVVTVRSTFQRKWSDEYIYQVKHVVPSCFDYVDGSATWDAGKANNVENGSGQNPGYAKITSPNSTSWRVPGLGAGWGSARAVSMQFTVTAACATGETQETTLHYGGSLGQAVYQAKGPTITVAKTDNGGGDNGGGDNGGGDNGGGDNGGGDNGGGDNGGGDNGGGDNGGTGSLDTGSLANLFG